MGGFGAIFSLRWSKIFLITTKSSMQALTCMPPLHSRQASMLVPKSRFARQLYLRLQPLICFRALAG